jgi:hypothetical protein
MVVRLCSLGARTGAEKTPSPSMLRSAERTVTKLVAKSSTIAANVCGMRDAHEVNENPKDRERTATTAASRTICTACAAPLGLVSSAAPPNCWR